MSGVREVKREFGDGLEQLIGHMSLGFGYSYCHLYSRLAIPALSSQSDLGLHFSLFLFHQVCTGDLSLILNGSSLKESGSVDVRRVNSIILQICNRLTWWCGRQAGELDERNPSRGTVRPPIATCPTSCILRSIPSPTTSTPSTRNRSIAPRSSNFHTV